VAKLVEFHASLTPQQKAKAVEHLRHFQEMHRESFRNANRLHLTLAVEE
jgi:hypothetical protein